MDKLQKVILFSLISISAIAWVISKDQPDMMKAMMTLDPISILLFTASWTVGMAAMMFPAISPMVLLYNRLIKNGDYDNGDSNYKEKDKVSSAFVIEKREKNTSKHSFFINYSFKILLFVNAYLLIWILTGIALLLVWSVIMNTLITSGFRTNQLDVIYGVLLIISGVYQFSPLKTKCIGYCESPLSFFMRRWKSGKMGAIKMGIYHGIYCLGCCWPYFLLMVALGWMNLIWMGLFSTIIFAEKIWSRGLLVARIGGIVLMTFGIVAIIFTPNAHSFLKFESNDERNKNDQPMDMKEMMYMEKGSTDNHKQYNVIINNNNITNVKK
jgi:predicted metal-binding membrane protein